MARFVHSESEETAANPPRSPLIYQLLALLIIALLIGLFVFQVLPAMVAGNSSPVTLVVYGFSTQEEVFSRDIFPAFEAAWEAETGRDLIIKGVFGPSGTLANQIVMGAPADVAVFSNAQHVNWLKVGKLVGQSTEAEIIGSTPMVIVVRPGNPADIHEFADLTQEGLKLLLAEPGQSGAGEWSVLAEYGSTYLDSSDHDAAAAQLKAIWDNVTALGTSARGTLNLFEMGAGDALVTYEQDALQAQERGARLEVVLPLRTIMAQPVAVVIDANVTKTERAAAEDFVRFLLSDDGQRMLAESHMRPPDAEGDVLPAGSRPFTVAELGGWSPAYRDLIDGLWKEYLETRQRINPLPTLHNGQD